jgi:hypothetical protein
MQEFSLQTNYKGRLTKNHQDLIKQLEDLKKEVRYLQDYEAGLVDDYLHTLDSNFCIEDNKQLGAVAYFKSIYHHCAVIEGKTYPLIKSGDEDDEFNDVTYYAKKGCYLKDDVMEMDSMFDHELADTLFVWNVSADNRFLSYVKSVEHVPPKESNNTTVLIICYNNPSVSPLKSCLFTVEEKDWNRYWKERYHPNFVTYLYRLDHKGNLVNTNVVQMIKRCRVLVRYPSPQTLADLQFDNTIIDTIKEWSTRQMKSLMMSEHCTEE